MKEQDLNGVGKTGIQSDQGGTWTPPKACSPGPSLVVGITHLMSVGIYHLLFQNCLNANFTDFAIDPKVSKKDIIGKQWCLFYLHPTPCYFKF